MPASPPPRAGASLRRYLPVLVLTLGAAVRLVDLGHVDRIHFDEAYYAVEAQEILDQGVTEERPAHPPLGKLLIAAGMAVAGVDPTGWRLAPAVAGTLTVAVTYAAGLIVLRNRVAAAAAASLVALDGLSITMSRIAMLDAILALFVALAGTLVLLHWRDAGRAPPRRTWLPDGWALWAAGLAAGLAAATKWSGLLVLGAAVPLALWVEVRRRRAYGSLPLRRALPRVAVAVAVPLLVVPAGVYVTSYASFFVNYTDSKVYEQRCPELDCPAPVSERIAGFAFHHRDLVRMHLSLPHTHPYRSDPQTWPILQRPVLMYLERCPTDDGPCVVPEGTTARIVNAGNPALWWPALLATPVLGWLALRRRDRMAIALVALLAALYVPWFAAAPGYLYYLLPLAPFAAVGLVLAIVRVAPSVRARIVLPWAVVAAAAVLFAYLLPVWYGLPLGPDGTDARLLLDWR